MSIAPVEVTTGTETPSGSPGLRSTPPVDNGARRRNTRIAIIASAAVVMLAAFLLIALRGSKPSVSSSKISGATITANGLRLKGTTEAVQSRSILAPLLAGQKVQTLTII